MAVTGKIKVAVIGGGSWATAIVKMLSDSKNADVSWWMRDLESVNFINKFHHNPRYIPSAQLRIKKGAVSTDLKKVIHGAHFVVMAVPAAFLKEALSKLSPGDLDGKVVVSAIKGMIPDENLLIANFFFKYFNTPETNFLVISGPCHAEEVAQEKLSYLTIAGQDSPTAQTFAQLLRSRYMNANVSEDIYGTEYAAVMKNIYAIAGGIAHGLGYGDNFIAVLISNAIIELKRFLAEVYPIRRDIKESAYLGDLLVTAYSQHSRNRSFGNMIGKGYSVRSAQFEMAMVAEGYYAIRSVHQLNKRYKVDLPIAETVYRILYEAAPAKAEFAKLTDQLR